MTLTDICSKCGKNGMECQCEQFHPNVPPRTSVILTNIEGPGDERCFTIEELKALYRILEPHYIDYDDKEAHAVVDKIARIVNDR